MNGSALIILAATLAQTPPDDASPDPVALARQVHAIFQAKCVECHSSDLANPEGDFGFVLDLERVGDDEDLIVAGNPNDSELFFLVDFGDMPPPDSKFGSLSREEVGVVRDWIMAGAPGLPQEVKAEVDAQPAEAVVDTRPFGKRLLDFLGQFHPMSVHFPIALLIIACLCEWAGILCKRPPWRHTACVCLVLGTAAAVLAAPLGWFNAMFAGFSSASAETLFWHRWLGVSTAVWAVVTTTLVLVGRKRSNDALRRLGAIALLVGAIAVGITGHLGGKLTHGEGLYDWPTAEAPDAP